MRAFTNHSLVAWTACLRLGLNTQSSAWEVSGSTATTPDSKSMQQAIAICNLWSRRSTVAWRLACLDDASVTYLEVNYVVYHLIGQFFHGKWNVDNSSAEMAFFRKYTISIVILDLTFTYSIDHHQIISPIVNLYNAFLRRTRKRHATEKLISDEWNEYTVDGWAFCRLFISQIICRFDMI